MKPIIRVQNLCKQYQIGAPGEHSATLRESLAAGLQSPLKLFGKGRRRPQGRTIWALKETSFDVMPGEVVGVIGHNGAGKSTLFRILSRVTDPTGGRAELYGRVSSLLEVGTGFHPELTGRENIFLNGSILGMSRGEIMRKFDEIVAFSEIETFLDTPVKRYSSGMYMRLAFAVAAHLEPDILLVDEVLAVGDAAFQRKCLGKLGDVASEGRTVLFISHNMTAIQALCDRVLWLSQGEIVKEADADSVVSSYLNKGAVVSTERVWTELAAAPGNDQVRLQRACARPAGGSPADDMTTRTNIVLEFDYWNLEPGAQLNLSLHLYNEQGIVVFNTFPSREPVWNGRPFPAGLFRSACHIPGNLLNDGMYRVLFLVVKNQAEVIFSLDDALTFNVLDSADRRGTWHGKWVGAVRPDLDWETEYLGGAAEPAPV